MDLNCQPGTRVGHGLDTGQTFGHVQEEDERSTPELTSYRERERESERWGVFGQKLSTPPGRNGLIRSCRIRLHLIVGLSYCDGCVDIEASSLSDGLLPLVQSHT